MEEKLEENMKVGWSNLRTVDTIFEDDEDDELQSLSSPRLSLPFSSPSSPIQSGVDAWTTATGRKPDVKIHVRGICFHLHKDVLILKSSYLKRQLIRASEFTLSPPLKITADTFQQVADFCYSNHAVITPFNVAALRTAAGLLEMDGDGSLSELTESYFCEIATVNRELTGEVFRSCLTLLPEAEQTAFLASRCLEALFGAEDDGVVSCADGLKTVLPEGFRVIAGSMHRRYTRSHDLLYRVIDLYFLVYNGKMSEEQKSQITSCIDCNILSPALLMHAVQNPRMPLRFIVQAMLLDQLTTHRSLFSGPASTFLHLRSAVDATCSRIHTLERELSGMKKLLLEDQTGSSSCRFTSSSNKVQRADRGSISSSIVRFVDPHPAADHHCHGKIGKRNFGQRLIRGLKNVFGVKNSKLVRDGKSVVVDDEIAVVYGGVSSP